MLQSTCLREQKTEGGKGWRPPGDDPVSLGAPAPPKPEAWGLAQTPPGGACQPSPSRPPPNTASTLSGSGCQQIR